MISARGKSWQGVIIEESLEDRQILKKVKILETRVEPVAEAHKTPWLQQWTLHTVVVPEAKIVEIVQELSQSLDSEHSAWYADIKNDDTHFIIFRNRVFEVDRTRKEQYEEATRYGASLGIPAYQLDFSPHIVEWER